MTTPRLTLATAFLAIIVLFIICGWALSHTVLGRYAYLAFHSCSCGGKPEVPRQEKMVPVRSVDIKIKAHEIEPIKRNPGDFLPSIDRHVFVADVTEPDGKTSERQLTFDCESCCPIYKFPLESKSVPVSDFGDLLYIHLNRMMSNI